LIIDDKGSSLLLMKTGEMAADFLRSSWKTTSEAEADAEL